MFFKGKLMASVDNSYYYNGNKYVPKTENDNTQGFILASVVSSAIMGTLPVFGKPFEKQLQKETAFNHEYKDAFLRSIKEAGLDSKGVNIVQAQNLRSVANDFISGRNACYVPATKQIILNTDKISIAGFHEVGHAMNHLTGKFGKVLQKLRAPGYALAGLMGTVALFTRPKPKEAPKTTGDFVKDNCGKIAFLGWLPTVIEEAMASYKGVKLARKSGVAEPLIKNMKKLYAKAFLTYAGRATATGLAVGAASMIMDKFSRPKKIEEDNGFYLFG